MALASYPFDVAEERVVDLISKTVRQYHMFESSRIGREIRNKLRFCSYNTTGTIAVSAFRRGHGRILVYISAVAPNGRPYELETEVVV